MVRTKADGCTKASGGKASRKTVGQSSSSASPSSAKSGHSGAGNVMKIWPTPEWQKGVGSFFPVKNTSSQQPSNNDGDSTASNNSDITPQASEQTSSSSSS